jgi:hypothetical protein
MIPRVTEARYVSGRTIWLRFSDGAEGEVDLSGEIHGEIFEPLRDVEYFREFELSRELGTVAQKMLARIAKHTGITANDL